MAAERTAAKEKEGGAETPAPAAVTKPVRWQVPKWAIVLAVATIVAQATGLAYYRMHSRPAAVSTPEFELGGFQFEADKGEGGRVAQAQFDLCLSLLEPMEQAAKQRLAAHKNRVRQDVEELVRRAHSGDFDDPSLHELKRQVQERVDQTLGMRAIAEVIITELRLQHNAEHAAPVGHTAQAAPWKDGP
jgi:hypothetical protein